MWELDYKESWVPKNWCFCTVVLEKTLESPLDHKQIQPVHPEGDQFWVFIGRTDVEAETPIFWLPYAEGLTYLKRPWCWVRLRAGGEGANGGWDGWMASLTQWTWVWVNSGSWWWRGKSGMRRFMGSQSRTRLSDWIELNWIVRFWLCCFVFCWATCALCICWKLISYQSFDVQIFSSILWFVFSLCLWLPLLCKWF